MHLRKNIILLAALMTFTLASSIFGKECQRECTQENALQELVADKTKVSPKITPNEVSRASDHNTGTPVKIVVYSDFECHYCAKGFNETMAPLLKDDQYSVSYTYKHFPLEKFHPVAKQAALYYEALRLQDEKKAISFHDQLMVHQDELIKEKERYLDRLVMSLNGNMEKLKNDIKRPELTKLIEDHKREAMSFGLKGTPSYVINGTKVIGHRTIEEIKTIIDKNKS